MSIEPPTFGDDWRKRWVQREGRSDVLHRIAVADTEDWEADHLVPIGVQGTTVCNLVGRLGMPGILSRMGAPRCKRCCRKLGLAFGYGAPFNDKALSDRERGA